jgi:hypothetical protein
VGTIEAGELRKVSEAQLAAWAKAATPVVLMTRDVDDSGEIAANVAPDLFEEMVADLARAVAVLHRAGYRRVVIGTDHGFLLVPAGAEVWEITAPSKADETTFSTRYAVGALSADGECLAFTAQQLGRSGSARTLLPRGLTTFGIPGPRHRFVHGGLSPQECVLRFITSTMTEAPRAAVRVRLVPVAQVTSLILYLPVEVTTPAGPAQHRRVRAEARCGDRVVGRSEVVVYKPQAELGPGENYPRIKLVLKEPAAAVDLTLYDDDSNDVLDSQQGVSNVMRREDGDLL